MGQGNEIRKYLAGAVAWLLALALPAVAVAATPPTIDADTMIATARATLKYADASYAEADRLVRAYRDTHAEQVNRDQIQGVEHYDLYHKRDVEEVVRRYQSGTPVDAATQRNAVDAIQRLGGSATVGRLAALQTLSLRQRQVAKNRWSEGQYKLKREYERLLGQEIERRGGQVDAATRHQLEDSLAPRFAAPERKLLADMLRDTEPTVTQVRDAYDSAANDMRRWISEVPADWPTRTGSQSIFKIVDEVHNPSEFAFWKHAGKPSLDGEFDKVDTRFHIPEPRRHPLLSTEVEPVADQPLSSKVSLAYNASFPRVEIGAAMAARPIIQFIDALGETIELAAAASDPYPVVTLEDVSTSDVSIAGEVAVIELSGTVRSALADIVADAKADIDEVAVEIFDHGRTDNEDLRVHTANVNRLEEVPQSSLRPYPFTGTFTTTLSIPVGMGDVDVWVRTTNLIGNEGYDSLTVSFTEEDEAEDRRGARASRTTETAGYQVTQVRNHPSTDPGLVNPLRVRIEDSSLGTGDLEELSGSFAARPLGLKVDDGQLQFDRPLMALIRPFPSEVPNLVNVTETSGPSTVSFGATERKIHWSTTTEPGADDQRANYFTYAAGTKFEHDVRGSVFREWRVRTPDEARVQHFAEGVWAQDSSAEVVEIEPLPGAEGLEPGVRLTLALTGESRATPEKRILFSLYQNPVQPAAFGNFRASRLKTVIIAVDGLGHSSISSLLTNRDDKVAPSFKAVFGGSTNQDKPALAALPTVTWANWPGVFSGQPPSGHGITGNAVFERERGPERPPFNSDVSIPSYNPWGREAVREGLNKRARHSARSLYDDVGAAGGFKPNVASVHMWYSKSTGKRVVSSRYGLWPRYKGHGPKPAAAMDRASSQQAVESFKSRTRDIDMLTVYFPGPDNAAHAVGNGRRYRGYTRGPALPEVAKPLTSIGEHARKVTDKELGLVYAAVKNRGYAPSTIFALVADHGLHAFKNDRVHNIFPEPGLTGFFKAIGMNAWEGKWTFVPGHGPVLKDDIRKRTLVYSPNGGMAQIYLRDSNLPWSQPPTRRIIENVVRMLYIEAVAGQVNRGNVLPPIEYAQCPADLADRAVRGELPPCWVGKTAGRGQPSSRLGTLALGNPPAIFARVGDATNDRNHFKQRFRWVKGVNPTSGAVQWGTVADFLKARKSKNRKFSWPDFAARLKEMNDRDPGGSARRGKGSRTGDVLIFMDGRAGFLTVSKGDEDYGWHGGATASESHVPLMLNIPGSSVDEEFIRKAVRKAVREVSSNTDVKPLRNWHLSHILQRIYKGLYRPTSSNRPIGDFRLEFVVDDGVQHDPVASVRYDGPFYLQANFAEPQQEAWFDVNVQGSEDIPGTIAIIRSPTDARVYRSRELTITRPTRAAEPAQ